MIPLYGRNPDGSAVRALPPFDDRLPVLLGVLSQANCVRTMAHSLCRVTADLKLTHPQAFSFVLMNWNSNSTEGSIGNLTTGGELFCGDVMDSMGKPTVGFGLPALLSLAMPDLVESII